MYVTHAPRTLVFVAVAAIGAGLAGYAVYSTPPSTMGVSIIPALAPPPAPGLRESSMVAHAKLAVSGRAARSPEPAARP